MVGLPLRSRLIGRSVRSARAARGMEKPVCWGERKSARVLQERENRGRGGGRMLVLGRLR